MSSTFGFTPGQPPEWDIERFMRGDEVDTAGITLERNRRTFAWKCADVGAEGLGLRLGASSVTLGGLLKHLAWRRRSSTSRTGSPVVRSWRHSTSWTSRGTGTTGPGLRRPTTPPMPCGALGRHRSPLPRRAGRSAVPRWAGADHQRRDEPAPIAGRHDRGVRPPHRPRRPAPRASRRSDRRRPPNGLPSPLSLGGSKSGVLTARLAVRRLGRHAQHAPS